jgi:hypothetical protein
VFSLLASAPIGCKNKIGKEPDFVLKLYRKKQKGTLSTKSLQHNPVNFNSKIPFDFNGGNPSSDSGLLLVRSFLEKSVSGKLWKTYLIQIKEEHIRFLR